MRLGIRFIGMLAIGLNSLIACANDWPQFGGPNGNFTINNDVSFNAVTLAPTIRWEQKLGAGLSGLAAIDGLLFATYLTPATKEEQQQDESERAYREVIVALERATGEPVWKYDYESGWIDSQEAFGGKARAPQATPLVHQDHLVSIGFTGWLHCLDVRTGKLKWKTNLVEQFGSVPVQFGFSASPIAHGEHLIALAGGNDGGLICFDIDSGEPLWKVACQEASYATPIIFRADDTEQVVFMTRNQIIGVDLANGKSLWRYTLPKSGMTNVPTPLVLGDGRLAISGQGIGGTKELQIARQDGSWQVREGWNSRVEFFYTNWIRIDDLIFGCNGELLTLIDAETGERLGRWRGYSDSNAIRTGNQLIVLDGGGTLSVLKLNPDCLEVTKQFKVMNARCWTPATLLGNALFCRGDDRIVCVDLCGTDLTSARRLESQKVRKRKLSFRSTSSIDQPQVESDPVDRIVTAFEDNGAEQAWEVYQSIRQADAGDLSLEQRRELAELALSQGLTDFGTKILDHAIEDFPIKRLRSK